MIVTDCEADNDEIDDAMFFLERLGHENDFSEEQLRNMRGRFSSLFENAVLSTAVCGDRRPCFFGVLGVLGDLLSTGSK